MHGCGIVDLFIESRKVYEVYVVLDRAVERRGDIGEN